MPNVRVFITYSHDSNEHIARVLALADRLRSDGLDVRLDQYEPHPPTGWLRWMQHQLQDADFVVVICTYTYCRRFEGDEVQGVGRGVTWEGALTRQILYDAGTDNHRFIPVLFDGDIPEHIPVILRSTTRYILDAGYDDLLRRLTDQPKTPPPPIGEVRRMPPAPRSTPTASPASRGIHIYNQGASIGQIVNVQGTAYFGALAPPPAPTPAPAKPKLTKILLATANSCDRDARLFLDHEERAIRDALKRSRLRDRYELRVSPAVTFDALIHELDDDAPQILQISGHGDRSGTVLKTSQHDDQHIDAEKLCRLFASLAVRPELVIFAACDTLELAKRVVPYVGAAIGFSGPLTDAAACHFSAVLYERLAAHEPRNIPRAFTLAQLAAVTAGFPEIEGAGLVGPRDDAW